MSVASSLALCPISPIPRWDKGAKEGIATTKCKVTKEKKQSLSKQELRIGIPLTFAAFALANLNPGLALAAADDPSSLCLSFGDNNAYTVIAIACVLQAVALVGAAVGGTLARQRKLEVEKINGQLRQIFAKMRRQYQVETYAPSLTYAPATLGRSQDLPQATALDPAKQELTNRLRGGKRFLREKNPQAAFDEFQKAMALAKELNDRVEQKKAARGLGASCQRQGKFREAIKHHSMVLTIAHLSGEHSGYTEALGAIADCYTELGDLENAAKFYDQYIARLDNEED
ncbi:protein FLUORESCENT IN BLUE LIGHT, chloroplastic [Selaginella moellendorffii]|uniref:protein FLUORESCENT IN BLUE LIGHT, chloroplastic n=1 Tax=Selaginella moellendorffii TaxID=88036 RepID=UPI000D1C6D9E|nr:protein FLUORESCENT IN BLUE LIGHT, chloroplastic [Selaginella moellendorffii]|eukprot:XP_002988990.2 protein FLUORESCENT IN BLUE LIGHT, chloroplastic [Selaginella moellendorffii]